MADHSSVVLRADTVLNEAEKALSEEQANQMRYNLALNQWLSLTWIKRLVVLEPTEREFGFSWYRHMLARDLIHALQSLTGCTEVHVPVEDWNVLMGGGR